jgi:hypothetical protein
MNDMQYKDFWAFIKLLNDNQLLDHIILIGSWAEYVYAQSGILQGYSANLRTLDIDFLIKNMRIPQQAVNIPALAKEMGYTVAQDVLEGTTKIYTPDLMEIEFLIAQKGKGDRRVMKTSMGVYAQALRHLSPMLNNTIAIELFDFSITVPSPESYVIHKMIINKDRGVKKEKDQETINSLFPYLDSEQFNMIVGQLTLKESKLVNEYIEQKVKR